MRYDFVERHRDRRPVRLTGRALRVSPGGYYDRRGRPASAKTRGRAAPVVAIGATPGEVKARYGSPRIHAEWVARGEACGVNTVAGLMRGHGLAAETKRKFRRTTDSDHGRPAAENVTDRQFEPAAPDRCDGRSKTVARAGRKAWRPDLPGYSSPGPASTAGGGGSAAPLRRLLRASLSR